MKKVFKYILLMAVIFLSDITLISAKDPQVLGVSVPTVYGAHDPIDTSLGGIEWIFVLALFIFLIGLSLVINGKALNSQLEK